jgi:IPT/TIG domain
MRKLLKLFTLLAITAITIQCEQPEDAVRTYPRFESSKITSITRSGVTLEAFVVESTISNVIDHGFVWSIQENTVSIDKGFVVSFGKLTAGKFEADIRSQLLADKTYFIRPFMKTSGETVYGFMESFKSLGSQGPTIESFSPSVVLPKDVVTIKGKYFGNTSKGVTVAFKGAFTSYPANIKTLTDTEITVIVPDFWEPKANIVITTEGNTAVTSTEQITRVLPTLLAIKETSLCEPVKIAGENLIKMGLPAVMQVDFENVKQYATFTDTEITLPARYHRSNLPLYLSYKRPEGGSTFEISKTLADPYPRPSFANNTIPEVVKAGDTFIIQGTNIPNCESLNIYSLNNAGQYLSIENATSTQITIKVAATPCEAITMSIRFGTTTIFESSTQIKGPEFQITNYTLHGMVYDELRVTGSGLSGMELYHEYSDEIGNIRRQEFYPISGNDTQMIYSVPPPTIAAFQNTEHQIDIAFEKCGKFVYPFNYDLFEPKVTGFSPKTINTGQGFTIMGTGLDYGPDNEAIFLQLKRVGSEEIFPGMIIGQTDTSIGVRVIEGMFSESTDVHVILTKYGHSYNVGILRVNVP